MDVGHNFYLVLNQVSADGCLLPSVDGLVHSTSSNVRSADGLPLGLEFTTSRRSKAFGTRHREENFAMNPLKT